MKRKRKFTFLTIGLLCLWPIIVAAKNTAQKQNNEKSDSDNLAQNITLVLKTIQEAKGLAKNTKKESIKWREQINKTTKTAEEMTKKLSDFSKNFSDDITTLKHESREWRKESKEIRKELVLLREELGEQVSKVIKKGAVKGAGIIFLVIALGLILKTQLSNEKGNYPLLGTASAIGILGGVCLFLP